METTALTRSASVEDAASPTFASPSALPDLHVARPRWLIAYTAVLVMLDGAAMAAATLTAKISWLGIDPEPLYVRSFSIPYAALTLATVPTWLVLLALAGAYDLGPFASDTDDWTRVIRSGAQLLAVIAVAYYIVHLALLGRGVLAGTVPFAVILTLGGRTLARLALGQLRRRGHARRTALVIGSRDGVDAFVRHIESRPTAAVTVVGVSVIGDDGLAPAREVRGGPTSASDPLVVSDALARTGAETLIVTGGLEQGQLRDIAWMLQGTGIELMVIPTPADIEGLRTEIRPVAGLPLLYLDR